MKKISLFLIILLINLLTITSVKAANANFGVSTNKSSVIVGEEVTITVRISSSENLGSWKFDVVPSSNLTFVSSSFGGLYVADTVSKEGIKSQSYTFRFKANASGNASVSVRNSQAYNYNEVSLNPVNGSASMKLTTRAEIESSYSKNNNLSSLVIEGYNLTPTFNKDITTYTLEVGNDIEKINIKATKEDNKASISGAGEVSLSEGLNEIKVTVTAQNGKTKVYIVNVTVKELDPVEVTIDGNKYTVVRKEEFLPSINMYYEKTTVKIGDYDVPAYTSKTTKYTLVGLKDSSGNINLFIYEDGNYKMYQELNFSNSLFVVLEPTDKINGYEKSSIKFVNTSYDTVIYKSKESDFPLLYGMNVATGNTGFYKYDASEHTIQRYEEIDNSKEMLYLYIIMGLTGLTITGFTLMIIFINKAKKPKGEKEKMATL